MRSYIQLQDGQKERELLKAMVQADMTKAIEAQYAFAALLGPVLNQVINKKAVSQTIFKDMPFDEDDSPSIPLDIYYGVGADRISVWYQEVAGGLGTNHVTGSKELRLDTYSIESGITMLKKYAQRARQDVVADHLNRLTQEMIRKLEINAWTVLMRAAAQASTNGADHIITSTTQDVFQVDDLSRLITLSRRIGAAWDGGTPADGGFGATDLFISPEIEEQIRGMAYNPQNTRAGSITTSGATALGLPEAQRAQILNAGGASELFGKMFHVLNEFGLSREYNTLFAAFVGSVAHGSQAYDAADDEVILGIDMGRDVFRRPVARQADSTTLAFGPDDQYFSSRQGKIGWWGKIDNSHVVLDARGLSAIIV